MNDVDKGQFCGHSRRIFWKSEIEDFFKDFREDYLLILPFIGIVALSVNDFV